jgi:tetratricopeptide (TPR) repeat protein
LYEYNIIIGILLLSSSFFIFDSIFAQSSLISSSSLNSTEVETLYNKATSLYDNQKYNEVIEYYDKALAIDPSSKKALNGKSSILAELKNAR